MDRGTLTLAPGVRVPAAELRFSFSRSAGPGGQHVNVTESQVELEWDISGSPSLSAPQRRRLHEALGARVDSRGVLHLSCQQTRSQHRNRALLLRRLADLVRAALRPRKERRPTLPSPGTRERRMMEKARRARIKQLRRRPGED